MVGLEVVAFDVEPDALCDYDYLTVNGVKYCGTSGPQGVVPEDGVIEWISDDSDVRSGWKARLGSLAFPRTSLMPLLPLPSGLLGDSAAFVAFTACIAASTAFTACIAALPATIAAASAATAHSWLCRRGNGG